MAEFRLCEKMGWSYQELMDTPADVVEKFLTIMSVENKKAEMDSKSNGN